MLPNIFLENDTFFVNDFVTMETDFVFGGSILFFLFGTYKTSLSDVLRVSLALFLLQTNSIEHQYTHLC